MERELPRVAGPTRIVITHQRAVVELPQEEPLAEVDKELEADKVVPEVALLPLKKMLPQ